MNEVRTDGRRPRRGLTIGIVIGLALSVGSGAMAVGDGGRPAAPTAPDPGSPAVATTPATPAAGVPVNTDAPDYDGVLTIGSELTADPGAWSGDPSRFSYQWFSCDPVPTACPNLPGATSATYTVQPTDAGNYIGVEIVASNANGDSAPSDSLVSGAVDEVIPVAESKPTLDGPPVVGGTLSSDGATWTDGSADISYQWYDCDASGQCDPINGANDATYTVTTDDLGSAVEVGASATNGAGTSDESVSDPTSVIGG
jgi:hypothetical protein